MLDCGIIKYSLQLINKHLRHVFYLQFTINVFQLFFLISVNEVIFYDDLLNFCKTYMAIHFRCTFFRVQY